MPLELSVQQIVGHIEFLIVEPVALIGREEIIRAVLHIDVAIVEVVVYAILSLLMQECAHF